MLVCDQQIKIHRRESDMTYLQTRGIYPCDLIDHLSIAHQEKSRYSPDDDIFCEFEGQLIHGQFVYRNFVDEFGREFFKEWGGDRLAGTCIATACEMQW
jgi:hypothetical protein